MGGTTFQAWAYDLANTFRNEKGTRDAWGKFRGKGKDKSNGNDGSGFPSGMTTKSEGKHNIRFP